MESHTSIIEFRSLKKTLRYGPKVKTGCRTCKLRRVRCDEGRPDCQKCTSTGRECAGYTQAKALTKPITRPTLKNALSVLSFTSDGVESLDFYHHCAAKAMSSRCDANFWQHLVPQMAQTEPAIRHALIALGCLNRAEPGNLKYATSLGEDRRGQVFVHYNKSVRHLVERINDASYTPEIGLVTCLLFVCIEFLRANYLAAFTHLYNGLKVISEWYRSLTIGEAPAQQPIPSFSVITKTAFDSATAMSDIVPMFFRAITSPLMMGQEIEKILGTPVSAVRLFETPFRSIYDARIAALEVQNAALVFERNTAPRSFPPPKVTAKNLKLQSKILESHRSWWCAFEQFKHSTCLTPKEKVIESELKACNLTTYIAAACATSIRQLVYDEHLDSFKEIVRHVSILLDSMGLPKPPPPSPPKPLVSSKTKRLHKPTGTPPQKPAANFTFDTGPLLALWFTLLRCRCPITRRAALAQMERGAPREALWDSEHLALISRRVIEIEEEKVDEDTGWPVEESRLWCAVPEGSIDRQGGFWVHFANASWVLDGAIQYEELTGGVEEEEYPGWRKRGDNQWQEHFVL